MLTVALGVALEVALVVGLEIAIVVALTCQRYYHFDSCFDCERTHPHVQRGDNQAREEWDMTQVRVFCPQ